MVREQFRSSTFMKAQKILSDTNKQNYQNRYSNKNSIYSQFSKNNQASFLQNKKLNNNSNMVFFCNF